MQFIKIMSLSPGKSVSGATPIVKDTVTTASAADCEEDTSPIPDSNPTAAAGSGTPVSLMMSWVPSSWSAVVALP